MSIKTVQEVLDGVLKGCFESWSDETMRLGSLTGLDCDVVLVVIRTNGTLGSCDDEAALGLGLDGPRIGERAPPRFKLGESVGISCDDEAMFIDLESIRFIHDSGDFERSAASLKPGSQGCAVAEII